MSAETKPIRKHLLRKLVSDAARLDDEDLFRECFDASGPYCPTCGETIVYSFEKGDEE